MKVLKVLWRRPDLFLRLSGIRLTDFNALAAKLLDSPRRTTPIS